MIFDIDAAFFYCRAAIIFFSLLLLLLIMLIRHYAFFRHFLLPLSFSELFHFMMPFAMMSLMFRHASCLSPPP